MLDFKNGKIVFANDIFDNAVMVDKISLSFTLKSEDIRNQQYYECTPYVSHKEYFDDNNYESKTDTYLKCGKIDGGLKFDIHTECDNFSEFGIYLPFNFMGKLHGGNWNNQYLFNSPYSSYDNSKIYCYFSSPSGRNILVLFNSLCDGWKMDYSEYVGGHFFDNFKILANFDKVYKNSIPKKDISFYVFEVDNFDCALNLVNKYLNLPVCFYNFNTCELGKELEILIKGKCDCLSVQGKKYPVFGNTCKVKIENIGENVIIPFFNGREGLNCSVYCYENLDVLYKKSMDAVSFDDINKTDGNLCEHQCWASAMIRYMLLFGKNDKFVDMVKSLLKEVTEKDENRAVVRRTLFNKTQKNGYPPFHIYGSNRIQEQFFGVTLLLDAFKLFNDNEYLDYATNSLFTLIDYYQADNGGFFTANNSENIKTDYSTVTCPMIPLVDMANFYKDKNTSVFIKFKNSADKLASYLYKRGLSFPTETEFTDLASIEMEDGSISCTALSLLYYCATFNYNKKYLDKALDILNIHDSWVVKTPLCCMYGSSLRWWETRWEGDADGPALCMGHAWTIWRAEADFWAYFLTKEKKYADNALCGFGSNFSKIDKDGKSYSVYQADYIVGGGFNRVNKKGFALAGKFPMQTDSGLSRYVWIRAFDTLLNKNL